MDISKNIEAATKALTDPSFAQEILEGKHNHPEIQAAILAELVQTRDEILVKIPQDKREPVKQILRRPDEKYLESAEAALKGLPEDELVFMREFIRVADPAKNPKLLQSFIRLQRPAGAFLVNLGARANAAAW